MDNGFGEEMRLTKRKREMGRRKKIKRDEVEKKKMCFLVGLKSVLSRSRG